MNRGRVLIVDDDPDIREVVCTVLERAGFDTTAAADGAAGLRTFYSARPDLVILDAAMPQLNGWQTLERIRELSDVPVIMLTAQTEELAKVRGLKSGADDYVTKPFGHQELIARVEARLRRGGERPRAAEVYSDPLLTINFPQRAVTVAGRDVALTPLEFRLLTTFARHPNQVLGHEQLLQLVWGDTSTLSRDQVKLYVGYLRRKLAEATDEVPIETVRGFGYRYRPPKAPTP